MSARILVVDDNPLNVKLLAAKLAKDYYFVSTATDGPDALEKAASEHPDLILLDIMMPGMSGFEVCEKLKADPALKHIPVVMVTALSDTENRVHGLEVGAEDFLTKPINDIALMARVRSLLRLKMMMDEWHLREGTGNQFGFPKEAEAEAQEDAQGSILLLEDDAHDAAFTQKALGEMGLASTLVPTLAAAKEALQAQSFDLVMASLDLATEDGLILCAEIRATEATRTLPFLLLAHEHEIERVARGLDLGANDYLLRPLEPSEMIARVRTQIKQKHHYDRLRHNYEQSLSLALVDPLTGAFNRRYLDMHLPVLFARALKGQRPLSVLYLDLDHFKQVNDTHGHPAGDVVLRTVIERVSQSLRPSDLIVRMGGEEFAMLLPETEAATAEAIAERLRQTIAATPIALPETGESLSVSGSFGVASLRFSTPDGVSPPLSADTPETLLGRADTAVLQAKKTGRNKVVTENEVSLES